MLSFAALLLSALALPVIHAADARVTAPRYVRMSLTLHAYGLDGRGTILVDRSTGRFVRTFSAGPASEQEGFDGERAWRADASGMARLEDDADERDAILRWAALLAGAKPAGPHPDAERAAGSNLVVKAVIRDGDDRTTISFADYRSFGNLVVPFEIASTSTMNGSWQATVRRVETPDAIAARAFAPPPPPLDWTLPQPTNVPLEMTAARPVIAVRIDGHPMHFILDTGGQNLLTPAAARRAGLSIVGDARVGGIGPGSTRLRYTTVRRLTVGAAVLRDQSFLVVDLSPLVSIDGLVGYEVLARLAARVDLRGGSLTLAPDMRALRPPGPGFHMVLDDRQPEVAGSLADLRGTFTIDTGQNTTLDIEPWFVQLHGLRARFPAMRSATVAGVGGTLPAVTTTVAFVRLGTARYERVPVTLISTPASAAPAISVAGNAGNDLLSRSTMFFDYAHARMWLADPVVR